MLNDIVFTKETETSTDERPSNPNQDGKPDDEIVREKLTNESPAAQSQVLQKETVEMNETPSSPIAPKSIETPVYTPSQTQQIEREPSDDTPALDTQVFTPNLTKERETQTSTDETPPKTNQEEGKTNDEIVIESPAAQTQVLQKETLEMNETPSSPISPKSIEAQVFTPIQKQQTVTEGTYEATQPLTEIISANNKKEDTHAVHHTPSSPLSSLIALVIEDNKNALSETETAIQYFSLSEGEETQSSRKNQAEENLKDTTKHTTELVSTDVSKTQPLTQPLTQQTQHLQTSEGEQSGETPSEQNQAEEYLKDTREPNTELVSTDDTTEPTTELVSTDVSKIPPITQQTEHLQTSAIDFSETNEVEVSRLLAHFQIGAEVEILSTDDEIWYPGKVVDLKLCEGLEELTVEYTTLFADQHRLPKLQDTITADKIRPATPTSDQKSFEMMDKVEVFYNNGWSSGQISMVLGDNTYSVCLYTSMETIIFKHSDLRIHREWKDGVWKMADKMVKVEYSAPSLDEKKRKRSVQTRVSIDRIRPQPPPERPGAKKSYELMDDVEAFDNGAWCAGKVKVILFDGTCFVSLNNSTEQIYFNHSEMRKPRKLVDGVWKMTEKMEEEQTQSVNPSEGDGDKKGKAKAVACKKNEAAANVQPVDLLPFLQREEKRPIRPTNPPMHVTPEVILPIDPFVTPEFPRFSKLAHWMDLRGIYRVPFYINGREIEKEFFQKMDDAENNLNKEHINVAFEMLNCKRVEQGAWFRNNNLPAACFVPVRFLEVVGYAYESVRKPHKKKQTLLEGCVGELVKGLIHPKKVWLEDVDVIYGVIEDMLSYHYIGVEIQLMDNTITLFHCGLPKANIKRALNQIQELAVLISAIKMELLGEEVNFEDISPFQVKFAEGLPKTKFPYNCGIFVVKMLECRSLGLKSMANINDETAMDLRSKLCCEIFDQFMDKDFQEGQRK
ncbi:unnamed protein product [Brassica rapa subsp. trilocularis]